MIFQLRTILLHVFVVLFCQQLFVLHCYAADQCDNYAGRLVSLQGGAQVQRHGSADWQTLVIDTTFCPGDMLRVLTDGRVAIALNNETVLRINHKSTVRFAAPAADNSAILDLLRGVFHIFSHRPRSLKVVTPYVNGVVEGTEFLVSVDDDSTTINVFEGAVATENQQGRLDLSSGQGARTTLGKAPEAMAVVRPVDAVEWTLYYPKIIQPSPVAADKDRSVPARQAADKLFVGRVDEARTLLEKLLEKYPQNSEALALSSIIETARNNKEKALEIALQAVDSNPKSAPAMLALSYARQALFDIPGALDILKQAAECTPANVLVKTRLAELLLATGELDRAVDMAQDAVSLNPEISLSHTVLGFAHLSATKIDQALVAFNNALMLDSAMPLTRLGLGLAKIRLGRLEEGRADLEIAAALNPRNALIRSYLGKAYFEEKRDGHAHRQYQISKDLDPADPTPWFYDALRKQSLNRPVEALHDLKQSIVRNDNRAIYRSQLLLDNDLASRSAGLARIYTDLGFGQLARVEGLRSVQVDPANYSAHRFLADTYSTIPRYEVARVSELLQSQLLQPLNITPVQPQLAESNMAILEGAGPSSASLNEFNPLFLRNRIGLQASGVLGSNGILGDELVASGVQDRLSYSLGQYHYQTDGIRENDDLSQDIYSAFVQGMLSTTTSLMTEIRSRKKVYGDLSKVFDPTDYSSSLRQSDDTKSARIGIRHDFKPNSILIGTAIISTDKNDAATGGDGFSSSIDLATQADNLMAEVQHIYRNGRFNLLTGAGYMEADENEKLSMTFPLDLSTEEEKSTDHTNIYSYSQMDLPYNILTTIGVSGDILNSPVKDRSDLNPKIGVTWQPVSSTLLRAAAFRTVARRLVYAQTIEPTSVAGFNQFVGDTEASASWTYGVGADHTFTANCHAGLEFYHRDLDVFYDNLGLLENDDVEEDKWDEDTAATYLYWTPFTWAAFGLEYTYDHFSRDRFGDIQKSRELTSHTLTPKLRFFHRSGLSTDVRANYVNQEGEFGNVFDGFTEDSEQFWTFDLALRYRLPERYGIFKVEMTNLFNEQFQFVDNDPSNPRFLPERQIVGSLTIVF